MTQHQTNAARTPSPQPAPTLPTTAEKSDSPELDQTTIFLKLTSQDGALYSRGDALATERGIALREESRGMEAESTRKVNLPEGTRIIVVAGPRRSEPIEASSVVMKTSGFLPWVGEIHLKDGSVIDDLQNAPGLRREPTETTEPEQKSTGSLSALLSRIPLFGGGGKD